MSLSAHRLLALALVAVLGGGGVDAVAVAKPSPKHRAARKAATKKQPRQRAHAVKLDAALAWVPPEALAGAPPLTGTTGVPGTITPPATTTVPTSGDTTPPPPGDAPPSTQAVGVAVDDRGGYSALLSRASVTAGSVVVQLQNKGEDDHNLRVVPTDHAGSAVDFPLTGPGRNTTRTLTLTAGRYRLFCTLTTPVNHETAGMHATLTVAPG